MLNEQQDRTVLLDDLPFPTECSSGLSFNGAASGNIHISWLLTWWFPRRQTWIPLMVWIAQSFYALLDTGILNSALAVCLLLPLTVFLGAVDHAGVHGLLQCVFVYGILGQGAFGKKGSGGFEWWVWYSLLNQQEPCHKSASLELRGIWSWESWERMCWPCCLKDHFICKNSMGRIHLLIITQPPWR